MLNIPFFKVNAPIDKCIINKCIDRLFASIKSHIDINTGSSMELSVSVFFYIGYFVVSI